MMEPKQDWSQDPSDYDMPTYTDQYGNEYYGSVFVNEEGFVPTCDVCSKPQLVEGDDWNGETGNHISCEAQGQGYDPLVEGVLKNVPFENATASERVAVIVTGLWHSLVSEHSTVVQFSEGRTLDAHAKDSTPQGAQTVGDITCDCCKAIALYDEAMNVLRPMAKQERAAEQEQQVEKERVILGVCVDCGNKPDNGRTYTLDEGRGYICSKCAGPFLLMDDGQPGDE